LPFIFCFEIAKFEIDRDQSFEFAVLEQEINVIVFVVDLEAFLAGDEGESGSKFKEKLLDIAEDGVFEIFFEVAIVEVKEVEDVGVFEKKIGCRLLRLAQLFEVVADGFFGFAREGSPLIEHGADAVLELSNASTFKLGDLDIKVALE
jgi:hypothetical protein